MPVHRAVRALTTSAVLSGLTALALAGPFGAASAQAATPTPTPSPLPSAASWVGGKDLIGTGVLSDLPAGVPAPPAPKAASWLVADLDSRKLLAGRRVHVPLAPASTLKTFTALAVAPRLDPTSVYTARPDDAAIDGTKVGLVPGSRYTVDDLLHGLLMSSGNDCANALGNLVGGRQRATELIQDQARALGAFDTVAHTTSGLDATGQVSSAYDLALAGSAALDDDQLAKIMKTTEYKFPGAGKTLGKARPRFSIQSHNRLLRNLPGATGVKNGYTIAARGSFIGSATRGGHHYIAVVMRAEGNTWRATEGLLDWAFAYADQARPVGTLVRPGELPALIGPAVGANGAALGAASHPSGAGSSATGGSAVRPALPSAETSLAKQGVGGRGRWLWLIAAASALVAVAFVAGRRPRASTRRGSSRAEPRPRSGSRVRVPTGGRHRS
jgi:D-alanyl-D-alanine carboxypeptidase (penicillin-binding protein 5/6)